MRADELVLRGLDAQSRCDRHRADDVVGRATMPLRALEPAAHELAELVAHTGERRRVGLQRGQAVRHALVVAGAQKPAGELGVVGRRRPLHSLEHAQRVLRVARATTAARKLHEQRLGVGGVAVDAARAVAEQRLGAAVVPGQRAEVNERAVDAPVGHDAGSDHLAVRRLRRRPVGAARARRRARGDDRPARLLLDARGDARRRAAPRARRPGPRGTPSPRRRGARQASSARSACPASPRRSRASAGSRARAAPPPAAPST